MPSETKVVTTSPVPSNFGKRKAFKKLGVEETFLSSCTQQMFNIDENAALQTVINNVVFSAIMIKDDHAGLFSPDEELK